MSKYCPNCGRPLQEGEICSCQNSQSLNTPAQYDKDSTVATGQQSQMPTANSQYTQAPMPGNQYTQSAAQFNQYNASGQVPQYNAYQGGNPYANHQDPPSYYQQTPYLSEEEHLKRFMSTPKFVAARDVMCSAPVLFYAISVTAIILFNFIVMQSFLHPIYLLLVIAAWLTFASGSSSKKTGHLPSTAGLSIGSGVATTMMVLWCIGFGLIILLFGIGLVGTISSGRLLGNSYTNAGVVGLSILLVISILALVLGIKYYSIQSRNIKGIRFCITNEAPPRRFSSFPSVILIIAIILTIIGLIYSVNMMKNADFIRQMRTILMDYFSASGMDDISDGFSKKMTDMIMDTVFSENAMRNTIISGALYVLNLASLAILHLSIKAKLKDFTEIA